MRTKKGYFKILIAAIIWGTIGAFARWSGLTPIELSFFRLLVATLVLYAFLPREERLIIFYTKEYFLICLCGVLFAVDCLLFFYALQLTTISNAVIPYNIQPVFITLLAPLFFHERFDGKSIAALVLSLTGVGMLLVPSVINLSFNDFWGITLALGGALLLSVIALIAKRLKISSFTFVYYEMLIATICLLPFVRITSILNLQSIAFVVVIGLVHTALAYIFYYDGIRTVKIQYAITLSYFAPVVAALTSYFLFREVITVYTIAGGLLIFINGAYVIFRNP